MYRSVSKPARFALSHGLKILNWKVLIRVALVVIGLLAADYGIGIYQRSTVEAKRRARAQLEMLAFYTLRADIQDLAMLPGNQYRLSIRLDNPFPKRHLYVMLAAVKVYIQGGTLWREIPSWPVAAGSQEVVVRLSGERTFHYLFKATLEKFEELIPGYMHVRVENAMYVSPRGEPQRDEVVERIDNYYVYLKPHGTSDQEILKRNRFLGGKVPLWIPMPPH